MTAAARHRRIGVALAAGLVLLGAFHAALALGAPLGDLAWGGRGGAGVLAPALRAASVAALAVLGVFTCMVLGRVGLLAAPRMARVFHVGCWILVVQLGASTLGNLASSSQIERSVMTPLSALMAVLALIVARGPRPSR